MAEINNIEELESKLYRTKLKCLDMCINAGIGHITSGFSCAEIVVALYYNIMNYSVESFDSGLSDNFIMSKNHGSVITFPILADLGFIDEDSLMTFMQDGSLLGGHSKIDIPGVIYSGGSLGMGLGVGAGLALADRMDSRSNKTFVLVGDSESHEGSIWESAMFAGHNKLSNLVCIVDNNRLGATDFTDNLVSIASVAPKWEAFGWKPFEINGHDMNEVLETLITAKEYNGDKPICIIANTIKGNGIDSMINNPFMHGAAPTKKDAIDKAYKQLAEHHHMEGK